MKKLLFLSIVSVFSFSGCLFFGGGNTVASCTKTDPTEQDNCLVQLAMNEHDREACGLIQGKEAKASCWLEIAVGVGDISACDNLGRDAKEKCISDYSNTGLINDMNACDEHEDREACLVRVGGLKNNPIPCTRTNDYNACLNIVLEADSSDRSPCDNVKEQDRLQCIIGSAQIFKDPKVCERLKGEEVEQCKEALDDGYTTAGGYYARLVCVLTVPGAWDDFFDDKTDEQIAEDKREYASIYQSFGYQIEEDANAAIMKYWGSEKFKQQVRDRISGDCPQAYQVAGFDLEDIMNRESGV